MLLRPTLIAGFVTLAALAAGGLPAAVAQTPGPTPSVGAPAPAPAANRPRTRIELPAERQKAQEASAPRSATTTSAPTAADLVPTEADASAPLPAEEPRTRIEQTRTLDGNRQVTVTPALTGRPYTMTQRDGQIPMSATGSASGLSVPKFFTFEWGRADERRAPAPPPPSTSTPR